METDLRARAEKDLRYWLRTRYPDCCVEGAWWAGLIVEWCDTDGLHYTEKMNLSLRELRGTMILALLQREELREPEPWLVEEFAKRIREYKGTSQAYKTIEQFAEELVAVIDSEDMPQREEPEPVCWETRLKSDHGPDCVEYTDIPARMKGCRASGWEVRPLIYADTSLREGRREWSMTIPAWVAVDDDGTVLEAWIPAPYGIAGSDFPSFEEFDDYWAEEIRSGRRKVTLRPLYTSPPREGREHEAMEKLRGMGLDGWKLSTVLRGRPKQVVLEGWVGNALMGVKGVFADPADAILAEDESDG